MNDCIVNTLPSICEQLTIFYFQETNQAVCVKYAIMLSLGLACAIFSLGGSAEQENFVPYHTAGGVTRVSVMPRKITMKIGDAENR